MANHKKRGGGVCYTVGIEITPKTNINHIWKSYTNSIHVLMESLWLTARSVSELGTQFSMKSICMVRNVLWMS